MRFGCFRDNNKDGGFGSLEIILNHPSSTPPDPHSLKKLSLFFPGYDGKFSFDFDSQWSTVFLDSVEPSADLSSMPSLGAMLNMPLIDAWRFWVIGGSFFFRRR